jgi:hypothetical protein
LGSGRHKYYLALAVLLVMAFCRAGWLYLDWTTGKKRAVEILEAAQKRVAAEVLSTYYRNFSLAAAIASSLEFERAFATRDRKGIAAALRLLTKKLGGGATTNTVILQENWSVYYASDLEGTDTEERSLEAINIPLVERALAFEFPPGPQNPFPCALCCLSQPDSFALSSFVPLREKTSPVAVLSVNTPFGASLLKEVEKKLTGPEWQKNGTGLAFYLMQGTKITACSEALRNGEPAYLSELTRATSDPFEAGSAFVEADNRLWKNLPMWGPDGQHAMGQVIICTSLNKPALLDPMIIGAAVLASVLLFARARSGSLRR